MPSLYQQGTYHVHWTSTKYVWLYKTYRFTQWHTLCTAGEYPSSLGKDCMIWRTSHLARPSVVYISSRIRDNAAGKNVMYTTKFTKVSTTANHAYTSTFGIPVNVPKLTSRILAIVSSVNVGANTNIPCDTFSLILLDSEKRWKIHACSKWKYININCGLLLLFSFRCLL